MPTQFAWILRLVAFWDHHHSTDSRPINNCPCQEQVECQCVAELSELETRVRESTRRWVVGGVI